MAVQLRSEMPVQLDSVFSSMGLSEKEKSAGFQLKTLDVSTLNFKDPNNVIEVVPASITVPPPPPLFPGSVVRKAKLKDAIVFALTEAVEKKWARSSHFSILLHEGSYTDDWAKFDAKELINCHPLSKFDPQDFSLDIFGLSNVRIVCQDNNVGIFGSKMSFNNLDICDPYCAGRQSTILIEKGAHVDFVNVEVKSPQGIAIVVSDPGSRARLNDCVIRSSFMGFQVMDGAEMLMNDGRLVSMTRSSGVVTKGSSYRACRTNFIRSKRFQVMFESKASFDECAFEGVWTPGMIDPSKGVPDLSTFSAIEMTTGASADITRTSIKNFLTAVTVNKSGARATLNQCTITNVYGVVKAYQNASATISDCTLQCDTVVEFFHNPHGVVEIKGNKVKRGVPKIVLGVDPGKLTHDFTNARIRTNGNFGDYAGLRDRSQYTKKTKAELLESKETAASVFKNPSYQTNMFKVCDRCMMKEDFLNYLEGMKKTSGKGKQIEGPAVAADSTDSVGATGGAVGGDDAEQKKGALSFKYCVKCKIVCYCSKECQRADWRDHKLVCEIMAKS